PYAITWNTAWVPDQDEPIQIMARVKNTDGTYYMTEAIGDLHLERTDRSVKLYKPFDVPGSWQTRADKRHRCKVFVAHDLNQATAARMILTTWSGGHADAIGLNDSTVVDKVGGSHTYSYDEIALPLHLIHSGTNEFFTYARTIHHGIEVLWPGIALKVQYAGKIEKESTAVLTTNAQPLPSNIRLLPNFPNPFNGQTNIRFELARIENIDLGIYNLAGQRLLTLTRSQYPSGTHTLQWDGRDASGRSLSSGVYFYRLNAGERVATKKLLLLR
ncbi:MAG: T9SS type A sorting domain-containing protein, partial [Gemmatimonadetes bacterium]|nr:T9SS type A sorting domain-containing protein [Gemmatimonadota bacterium]